MSDINKTLQQAKEALDQALAQKKLSQEILKNLGPAVIDTLRPVLDEIAKNSKLSKEELVNAISKIKIDIPKIDVPKSEVEVKIPELRIPEIKIPEIKIPEIKVPEIKIPEIKIPTIKVPKPEVHITPTFKVPEIKMPKEMDIKGWVRLMGVDLQNPLPVQLRDASGNPVKLFENLTTLVNQGGGGGKHDYFTIKGFSQSAYAEMMNADGRIKVSVETGGSGITDSELRASSVPVAQVSGSNWSVFVTGIFNSTSADVINPDNRIKVELPTGGSGLTDSELRASHLDVQQVSGAVNSVVVNDVLVSVPVFQVSGASFSVSANIGLSDSELRASSLPVSQVSGASWSTYVTGFGSSVVASLLNGDGDSIDPRDRNWIITEIVPISTTQSFETKQVSGFADSVYVIRGSEATTTAISVGADASTNVALTQVLRKSISLVHTSTSNLYISTGSASSTNSMPIVANQVVVFDDYTGPVNAIAEEQAGTISVRYIEII